MKPSEPLISFALAILLLVLWLGFLVHVDARFAGSLTGGILAVSGSLLLLVPLLYLVIKRIRPLKAAVTKKVSFATLLEIHIYCGFVGAILVLLHTGHKFEGTLATVLTASLLIVVFSGFTGRYIMGRVAKGVSEKRGLLSELTGQLESKFANAASLATSSGRDILPLVDAVADVEYAISSQTLFQKLFSIWLKIHIFLSVAFYFLLFLHVAGEYYYGLRWFQ